MECDATQHGTNNFMPIHIYNFHTKYLIIICTKFKDLELDISQYSNILSKKVSNYIFDKLDKLYFTKNFPHQSSPQPNGYMKV